jgi:fructose-specific phosphotransferase system IIC component
VIARHPYRAVCAVLAVMVVSAFVAGMVGQHNDGPWGGLPQWVGALAWFTFLGACLVILALSAYLAVANVRYRRRTS